MSCRRVIIGCPGPQGPAGPTGASGSEGSGSTTLLSFSGATSMLVTLPETVTNIIVYGWGAGGGGGGGGMNIMGSGGGAGGYAFGIFPIAIAGSQLNIIVGKGGTGGTITGVAVAGGLTRIYNVTEGATIVELGGGAPGTTAGASGASIFVDGGAGGAAGITINCFTTAGISGSPAYQVEGFPIAYGGDGGGPGGGWGSTIQIKPGGNGTSPGGGGGGCMGSTKPQGYNGGNGADGAVIITF